MVTGVADVAPRNCRVWEVASAGTLAKNLLLPFIVVDLSQQNLERASLILTYRPHGPSRNTPRSWTVSAGAGRHVMDRDVDAEFVGETLQFALPQPHAGAIAATAVAGDGQACGIPLAAMS